MKDLDLLKYLFDFHVQPVLHTLPFLVYHDIIILVHIFSSSYGFSLKNDKNILDLENSFLCSQWYIIFYSCRPWQMLQNLHTFWRRGRLLLVYVWWINGRYRSFFYLYLSFTLSIYTPFNSFWPPSDSPYRC